MNAKKIMGAVLVALLAAALFVGAGAAVEAGDVVFVNQNVTGLEGTWTSGTNSITAVESADGYGYFTGDIVEGAYTNGTGDDAITITVKYPTVTIVGLANKGTPAAEYKFIPGPVYAKTTPLSVTITSPNDLSFNSYLTYPNGTELMMDAEMITAALIAGNVEVGQYSIRAVFTEGFVNGTLYTDMITKPVAFNVLEAGAVSISAAADTVLKSAPVKLTITGQPGIPYNVTYDEYAFTVAEDQLGLPSFNAIGDDAQQKDGIQFVMPNTGKVEFAVKANGTAAENSEKITVKKANDANAKAAFVTIKFEKGTISAKADASSYFVGDDVKITGTSTAGTITNITIEGTNFKNTTVKELVTITTSGDNFEFELDTGAIIDAKDKKKLDVGTYTLTIKTASAETIVALVLKQPFISIAEAPEVVVQGDDAEFVINAEATTKIGYYIFGTNFFACSPADTGITENAENDDGETILNQFVFEIPGEKTENMSLGQYFVVVQHPMYDGIFQINGDAEDWVISAPSGDIDVTKRQTANAAQALCDALDAQNIDDMYVKYSFFIVDEDETSTMSELPTEVVKGETIVISGVDTANDGATVTAQMLSTAFAAVPKETTGSAAFIVVSTKIADDGTWELTLDTSDLNVDEYSLSVAINGINKETVTVNVVEGAETPDTPDTPDVPDTPDTPDTPTEPTTPGFGALAALAGLGAVAVLLLRRE